MLRWRRLTVAVVLVLGAVTTNLVLGSGSPSSAVVADGVTQRVSVIDQTNAQAPDSSYQSQISADGTQVAFVSQDDLTPIVNKTCSADVYVRNLKTGRTYQVSLGGTEQTNASGTYSVPDSAPTDAFTTSCGGSSVSHYPSLSADGRYVSFATNATNVVARPDQYRYVIVICNRDPDHDGVFDEMQPPNADGVVFPDYRCYKVANVQNPIGDSADFGIDGWPHLSADGLTVVWSEKVDLTCGAECIDPRNVVSVARLSTTGDQIRTPVVATPVPRTVGQEFADQQQPQVSGDGQTVVLQSKVQTTQLLESTIDPAGVPGPTRRVDYSDTKAGTFLGDAKTIVEHPVLSGDGSVMVFDAHRDLGGDLFSPRAYATKPPASGSERISVEISKPFDGTGTGSGYYPSVSSDGRYVAFVTDSPSVHEGIPPPLVPNEPDNCLGFTVSKDHTFCQVVARDLPVDAAQPAANATLSSRPAQLVSGANVNDCGASSGEVCDGNYNSETLPTLSADGGRVAFDSDASDLVPDDTNTTGEEGSLPARDAFVRTWTPSLLGNALDFGNVAVGTSETLPLTLTADGFGPQRIDDLVFSPSAADGFSIDKTGCAGQVLHETESCTVQVTFAPLLAQNSFAIVQVVHTTGTVQTTSDVVIETGGTPTSVTGNGTAVVNPPPVTSPPIVRTSVGDPSAGNPTGEAPRGGEQSQVSSDGNYDVFVAKDNLAQPTSNKFQNVFVRNLKTNDTVQISLAGRFPATATPDPAVGITPEGGAPNGDSSEPTISGDGRIVAFVTAATDIVPTIHPGTGFVTTTTVVCDRDPDGDGRFDEPQAGSTVPDYRCFYVFSETQSNSLATVSHPDLAADGNHLVYVQGRDAGDQADIVSLSHPAGGPLVPTPSEPVPYVDPAFTDATQSRPVVSNVGIGGNLNVVRVVFVAHQGTVTGILASDLGAIPPVTRRLDRVPGSSTDFIGTSSTAELDNPSITDNGAKVAFDFSRPVDSGIGEVYLTSVAGNAVTTQRIAPDTSVPAARTERAADPALSGDGRYLSFVTDNPFYGNGHALAPDTSCLNYSSDLHDPVEDDSCQIVARDLVVDAQRATAGSDLAPDELVTLSGQIDSNGTIDCGSRRVTLEGRCGGNATSLNPSMDRIGDQVGVDSWANDLVQGDTNTVRSNGTLIEGIDAFVRTFLPTISTGPLDFGNVQVGTSSQRPLTLSIVGFGPYPLGTVTVGGSNGGDYAVGPGTCQVPGQLLHRDESCTVSITFTPAATGNRVGTVTVTTPRNPVDAQIPVRGKGTKPPHPPPHPRPQFAASPNPLNFGRDLPLNTPGLVKGITVRNSGTGPLVIASITVTDTTVPNARNDYVVDPHTCGSAVPAGGRCTVRVTWIGRAVGARRALVRFVDNAGGGQQTVGLIGTVPRPEVQSNPTVSSPGRVILVTGSGFAPRRLVDITLAAAGSTASVKADARGRISASMVIFPNITIGPGTIIAHTHNVNATMTAQAPFLVMLGSLESPRLTMRH